MIDKSVLMTVATVGTFAVLVLLMFIPLPKDNAQIFLAIATFVLGYYFGSAINRNTTTPLDTPTAPTDPNQPAS